jgi:hypothetical protein
VAPRAPVNEPPETTASDRRSTSTASRLVIVGRVLLLMLAASAVAAGLVIRRRDESHPVTKSGGRYVCPMHPQVTGDAPADCPICHMALELKSSMPPETYGAAGTSPAGNEEASTVAQSSSLSPEAANLLRYSVGLAKGHVLPQELHAPAWFEGDGVIAALLYKDEIATLALDEPAVFFPTTLPDSDVPVHLMPEPPSAWDRSTSRVHFRVAIGTATLERGEPGWLTLAHKPRRMLVVPSSAVLESGDGPYVLAYSSAERKFTKRPVETGKVFTGFTAVVSGLREREVIVATNAFFLDAERRMQEGVEQAKGVP